MRRLLFSILTALMVSVGWGQVYHPFPDSNVVWSNAYWWYSMNDYTYTRIGMYGDTTINAIAYHKLYVLSDTTLSIDSATYWGAIREQGKKIYYIHYICSQEILLYDFTKQVGDTVHNIIFESLLWTCDTSTLESAVILGIDSTLINGEYRKTYHIGTAWNTDWIEGIGSDAGLFNPIHPPITGFDKWYLVCFKEGNQVYWLNPLFNDCFPLTTDIIEIEKGALNDKMIIPNPTATSFSIQLPQTFGTLDKLEIFNSVGQMVGRYKTVDNIDVSGYPKGLYFVVVTGESGERMSGRVVKE